MMQQASNSRVRAVTCLLLLLCLQAVHAVPQQHDSPGRRRLLIRLVFRATSSSSFSGPQELTRASRCALSRMCMQAAALWWRDMQEHVPGTVSDHTKQQHNSSFGDMHVQEHCVSTACSLVGRGNQKTRMNLCATQQPVSSAFRWGTSHTGC